MTEGNTRWRADRSFLDLVAVVRRRWWIVALGIVAAVAGSSALSSSQTPIYEADAQLLVLPRSTGAVFDQSAVTNALSLERAIDTEIRVIEGQVVRARVQRDLGLAQLPPTVSAAAAGNTDVIALRVRSGDPRVAQLLADAYGDAYIETRREQAVASLTNAQGELQVTVEELQGQIDAIDVQVAQAPEDQRAGLGASLAAQRGALVDQQASFRSRQAQFEVDAALTTGGASVVQAAGLPATPVAPTPVTSAILAAMLGALIGVGAAFALDDVDDSVRGAADVERVSDRPILAVVPIAASADPGPVALTAPHEPMVEAYRGLRTNLQFIALDDPLRVVLVTSSVPGEGKTTTATNLAVVLARAGQRVLLVDADLRKPNVHHALGLALAPGLTEVLLGEHVDMVVDRVDGFDVVTAGQVPPNPSELLASDRFAAVLRGLADRYDTVVVDSAPLLPVADTVALATIADGVVLVAQADRTSRRSLTASLGRLGMVRANLVGFVLNRARRPRRGTDAYGYGYGYGYGGAYGGGAGGRRIDVDDDDDLEWTDEPAGTRWWQRVRALFDDTAGDPAVVEPGGSDDAPPVEGDRPGAPPEGAARRRVEELA